ncbi:MAG: hypothetical protein LBR42_04930 [Candidatus Methanoplasma sp.]|jgi:hypothetical protein|nr:hypothetical protein [Candidatus Methanoplasma sp.]
MTKTFDEVQDIMPKNAFLIMAAVLIATDVFILLCYFIESVNTPIWKFAATTVIFAAMILFCFFVKLKISIEDDVIRLRFLKSYDIPFGDIIDYKTGDVDVIRNYSGWGIKKVTFKNLISIGYEQGISLKLTGRKVYTISIADPGHFASLLPMQKKE